jgi:hypothetical protein
MTLSFFAVVPTVNEKAQIASQAFAKPSRGFFALASLFAIIHNSVTTLKKL